MNCVILGEMGAGKKCLLQVAGGDAFPKGKKGASQLEGKTSAKAGKKTVGISFLALTPEFSHHGSGWGDEELIERLGSQKKGEVFKAVAYCVPARTYAARHASICDPKSINSWITMISKVLPKAPIIIVRTKTDLEATPLTKGKTDLGLSVEQANALVSEHERVCGVIDCSAKDGSGMEEFYDSLGKLIIQHQPDGSCVIC